MVRIKTVFTCSDGREFNTEQAVLYHERELLENFFGKLIDSASSAIGPKERLAVVEALFRPVNDDKSVFGPSRAIDKMSKARPDAIAIHNAVGAYIEALDFGLRSLDDKE